jgi:P4 family phage/plasmid primase-like protien
MKNDPILKIVAGYIKRRWSPVPIPWKNKKPIEDDWPNLRIKEDEVEKYFGNNSVNVGIVLGKASNNMHDVDLDCSDAVQFADQMLTPTATFGRDHAPRTHKEYYVTGGNFSIKEFRDMKEEMILELRGDNHQTIFPGSKYCGQKGYEGEPIRWDDEGEIATVDGKDLLLKCGMIASAVLISRNWVKTSRDRRTAALQGMLVKAGWDPNEIDRFTEMIALAAGDEEYRKRQKASYYQERLKDKTKPVYGIPEMKRLFGIREVKKILEWLMIEASFNEHERLTEIRGAVRFADLYKDDIRYCYDWGKWLVWNGKRWVKDRGDLIRQLCAEMIQEIYREAVDLDPPHRAAMSKWAAKMETNAKIEAIISAAQWQHGIAICPEDFDTDPWLFNVQNGTIDLRLDRGEGKLRDPCREDYITKLAPPTYDEKAPKPKVYLDNLKKIFPDKEERGYFFRGCGCRMTGIQKERIIFFFYGPTGNNGKTVLVENEARNLFGLGEYAVVFPTQSLFQKAFESGGIPNDIAMLKGVRLAYCSEGSTRRINENLIKRLTGGDTLTARFLRQEFFSFEPTHHFILYSNKKFVVRDTGNSIWDRIAISSFDYQFTEEERRAFGQDQVLDFYRKEESSGILNLYIEGCLEWQRRKSLDPPKRLKEMVAEYREEMDLVQNFLSEETEKISGKKTLANDVYGRMRSWADQNKDERWLPSRPELNQIMDEKGYKRKKELAKENRNKWVWEDLALKPLKTKKFQDGSYDPGDSHDAEKRSRDKRRKRSRVD